MEENKESEEAYGKSRNANKQERKIGRLFGNTVSDAAYGLSQSGSAEGGKKALLREAFEQELAEFFGED